MRIVQFRRHLDGYAVRVTDARDIAMLQRRRGFIPLMVVKQVLLIGRRKCYNTISAEFLFRGINDTTLTAWKEQVWGILKYRKYKVK
jgi:hypothetical protein